MTDADEFRRQFRGAGVETVRLYVANHRYPHGIEMEAIKWIAERDAEDHLRSESVKAEELDIARSARDAAFAANALAASANEIALAASDSARRSAEAAKTNNIIATLALIAAVIAIAISIFGAFIRR